MALVLDISFCLLVNYHQIHFVVSFVNEECVYSLLLRRVLILCSLHEAFLIRLTVVLVDGFFGEQRLWFYY